MTNWRHRTREPWPIDRAEASALVTVQRLLPWRWVVSAAKQISYIGEHSAAWLALATLAVILDEAHRLAWFAALVGTTAAHIVATAMKLLVRRPRPHDERLQPLGATMSSLSFPSSHSAGTSAFATGAAVINPAFVVPAVVLVILMGAARLRLAVHYPTDVLAGIALGVGCACVAQWAIAG